MFHAQAIGASSTVSFCGQCWALGASEQKEALHSSCWMNQCRGGTPNTSPTPSGKKQLWKAASHDDKMAWRSNNPVEKSEWRKSDDGGSTCHRGAHLWFALCFAFFVHFQDWIRISSLVRCPLLIALPLEVLAFFRWRWYSWNQHASPALARRPRCWSNPRRCALVCSWAHSNQSCL